MITKVRHKQLTTLLSNNKDKVWVSQELADTLGTSIAWVYLNKAILVEFGLQIVDLRTKDSTVVPFETV